MSYKLLHIFYEGPDDERFLSRVIKPIIEASSNSVMLIPYQSNFGKGKEFVINFIRSIEHMGCGDYLFLADLDDSPCITKCKDDKRHIYKNCLKDDKIIIVVREIEGWYYAGVEGGRCNELGIAELASTDSMTKEDFNKRVPQRIERLPFMIELLNGYSVETAKSKNGSFKYLMDEHILAL